MSITQSNPRQALTKARRRFALNLSLCITLLAVSYWFYYEGEAMVEHAAAPSVAEPEAELSLTEKAYLAGEITALKEFPGTMPEYEEAWVRRYSERAIQRNRLFDEIDETTAAELAEAFFQGYTDRFEEYYDTSAARAFGYAFGVKFNPDLEGLLPPATDGALRKNRRRLQQMFDIPDEASWRLFCAAFDAGFVEGYHIIQDGVTARLHSDKVRLFDD